MLGVFPKFEIPPLQPAGELIVQAVRRADRRRLALVTSILVAGTAAAAGTLVWLGRRA